MLSHLSCPWTSKLHQKWNLLLGRSLMRPHQQATETNQKQVPDLNVGALSGQKQIGVRCQLIRSQMFKEVCRSRSLGVA